MELNDIGSAHHLPIQPTTEGGRYKKRDENILPQNKTTTGGGGKREERKKIRFSQALTYTNSGKGTKREAILFPIHSTKKNAKRNEEEKKEQRNTNLLL